MSLKVLSFSRATLITVDALTNDVQARVDLPVMITVDHELGKMIGSVTCWS